MNQPIWSIRLDRLFLVVTGFALAWWIRDEMSEPTPAALTCCLLWAFVAGLRVMAP